MKCLKMGAAATDVEQSCLLPDHLKPKALSRGVNGSEFQLTVTFHIQRRKKKQAQRALQTKTMSDTCLNT